MEEAGEALAGGLSNISVIAPPAAAEATAAAADAPVEEKAAADTAAEKVEPGRPYNPRPRPNHSRSPIATV